MAKWGRQSGIPSQKRGGESDHERQSKVLDAVTSVMI
jgi:hypothetical protein